MFKQSLQSSTLLQSLHFESSATLQDMQLLPEEHEIYTSIAVFLLELLKEMNSASSLLTDSIHSLDSPRNVEPQRVEDEHKTSACGSISSLQVFRMLKQLKISITSVMKGALNTKSSGWEL